MSAIGRYAKPLETGPGDEKGIEVVGWMRNAPFFGTRNRNNIGERKRIELIEWKKTYFARIRLYVGLQQAMRRNEIKIEKKITMSVDSLIECQLSLFGDDLIRMFHMNTHQIKLYFWRSRETIPENDHENEKWNKWICQNKNDCLAAGGKND